MGGAKMMWAEYADLCKYPGFYHAIKKVRMACFYSLVYTCGLCEAGNGWKALLTATQVEESVLTSIP